MFNMHGCGWVDREDIGIVAGPAHECYICLARDQHGSDTGQSSYHKVTSKVAHLGEAFIKDIRITSSETKAN